MKKLIIFLKLLFIFTVFSTNSIADDLRDFILKQVEAREFNSEWYVDEYQNFIVIDDTLQVFTKAQAKELMDIAKESNLFPTIKSFNILSRSDTGDFISVSFEYEWEVKVGKTNMDGEVSGISVYLKTDDGGFISVFDAQTQ